MAATGFFAVLILCGGAMAQPAVTWAEHVAPILFEQCAPCHRPGEAAPFPLLTYADARGRARQIAAVTQRRYMPPWPPDRGHGEFLGERRLSDGQLQLLARWAASGAPEGNRRKAPPLPEFTPGWQLGKPDAVLRMEKPYRLRAEAGDIFRNFVVPTKFNEPRWVRAVELHPGNKRVVHHANIVVDRTRSLRHRDGEGGEPGFDGMDIEVEAGGEFDPDSHFLFWKPGNVPVPEPADMAWKLDPGTDLIVNLHLQPSGKPETIVAEVGLYFTSDPPKRFPMLVQLENDGAIDVPPGARDFAVEDRLKLPVDSDLLAIYPHAHYIGKRIEAWAELPGGERRSLLRISDWDINWQAEYIYRKPVALPAGTTVGMRIAYDNSTANPRNPIRPPGRVRAGNRSQDEMGHVWLQLLPHGKGGTDGRLALQEAVMRRRLEKYPGDFLAQFNLGSALVSMDRSEEGLGYLEKAARLQPKNATAVNAYGAAVLLAGDVERAIPEFRSALAADPNYSSARYNLARALAAKGDGVAAMAELHALLREQPEDGDANYLLANLLVERREYRQAEPYFRRAAAAAPDNADVQTNYGTVLAILGDLPAAIAAFERALSIAPRHEGALTNLRRARAELEKRPK